MPNAKTKMKYEVFLGIIFLAGGICSILIPASELEGRDISFIIFGITSVMAGTTYIWDAIKGLRERKREGLEIKNSNGGK